MMAEPCEMNTIREAFPALVVGGSLNVKPSSFFASFGNGRNVIDGPRRNYEIDEETLASLAAKAPYLYKLASSPADSFAHCQDEGWE